MDRTPAQDSLWGFNTTLIDDASNAEALMAFLGPLQESKPNAVPVNNIIDDARDNQTGSDPGLLTLASSAGFPWDGNVSSLADSGLTDASQLWLWSDVWIISDMKSATFRWQEVGKHVEIRQYAARKSNDFCGPISNNLSIFLKYTTWNPGLETNSWIASAKHASLRNIRMKYPYVPITWNRQMKVLQFRLRQFWQKFTGSFKLCPLRLPSCHPNAKSLYP